MLMLVISLGLAFANLEERKRAEDWKAIAKTWEENYNLASKSNALAIQAANDWKQRANMGLDKARECVAVLEARR